MDKTNLDKAVQNAQHIGSIKQEYMEPLDKIPALHAQFELAGKNYMHG